MEIKETFRVDPVGFMERMLVFLDDAKDRVDIHDRIQEELGDPGSDQRKQFDDLNAMLKDPALQGFVRAELAKTLGINPAALTENDLEKEIIDQLRDKRDAAGILKRPKIKGGVRRLVGTLLTATNSQQEAIAQEAAKQKSIKQIENYYNGIKLLAEEKDLEIAINDLTEGKWIKNPAKKAAAQKIGEEILQTINLGHTIGHTKNETGLAIAAKVVSEISEEDLISFKKGEPRGGAAVVNLVRQSFSILENARKNRAPDIKDTLGFWKSGRKKHLKGLEQAKKHRGGADIKDQKLVKGGRSKVVAPEIPKEIEGLGTHLNQATPSPDYSSHAELAAEQVERKKQPKKEENSLINGISNTLKLDKSQRIPDEAWKPESKLGKTFYYGPAGIPFLVHRAILRPGRLATQFLARNLIVRPANFIFHKAPKNLWNKGLKTPAVATGRLSRRTAWLAFSAAGLGIPSLIRKYVLDKGYKNKDVWGVKPYKEARAEWKAARIAKKQKPESENK